VEPKDVTHENTREILKNAIEYVRRSKDNSLTAFGITEHFVRNGQKKQEAPQFWIALGDGMPVGYMLIRFVQDGKNNGIQVWQFYLQNKWQNRHTGTCVNILENSAKRMNLKYISCVTKHNPLVYERWVKRFGYSFNYTSFKKEL